MFTYMKKIYSVTAYNKTIYNRMFTRDLLILFHVSINRIYVTVTRYWIELQMAVNTMG